MAGTVKIKKIEELTLSLDQRIVLVVHFIVDLANPH